MFRKLLSHLSSSPSLVARLGDYAKQLKHEARLRRVGVYMLVGTLLLHIFVAAFPPRPHTTAHESNLVYGGVSSREDLLQRYQQDQASLQKILHKLGLTPQDISATNLHQDFHQQNPYRYRFARLPLPSTQDGHLKLAYDTNRYIFASPLDTALSSEPALVGNTLSLGSFAILLRSGDIVVEKSPESSAPLTPAGINLSIDVVNNTRENVTSVKSGDHLTYNIIAKNTTNSNLSFTPTVYLHDILPYGDIINTDKGTIDAKKTTITWEPTSLKPDQSIEHFFTARIHPTISASARSQANPYAHDCVITTQLATSNLPVHCPLAKNFELFLSHLPSISPAITLPAMGGLFMIALLLYKRTRQHEEELRLIRHNINKGSFL